MARTIFKPGETYYLRYINYHIDPAPYLYVVYSDRNYTIGWNLHYLPNIRFNIPLESYKRVKQSTWKKAYENMREAGMFKGFIDLLEHANKTKYSRAKFKALVKLVSRRYPWAMKAYRNYHTNKLRPFK